jgi:hypothetical protein
VQQLEIARELGVSKQVVHNDLKQVRSAWKKDAEASIEEHVSRKLAELAEVKRVAWAQFQASMSKPPTTKTVRKRRPAGPRLHDADEEDGVDVTVCESSTVGDSRWLSVFLDASEQEARLLGLGASGDGRGVGGAVPVIKFELHERPEVEAAPGSLTPLPNGLKELPPGADPGEYEWVPADNSHAVGPEAKAPQGPEGPTAT